MLNGYLIVNSLTVMLTCVVFIFCNCCKIVSQPLMGGSTVHKELRRD